MIHPIKTISLLVLLLCSAVARSQQLPADSTQLHIGVLLPLYLDSAFDDAGNYKQGKAMPPYFLPGIEAYLGVLAAVDSLKSEKTRVAIHVFDLRSAKTSAEALLRSDSLGGMDLLMGHVNLNEAALIAKYALTRKVPFLNMNLPNEAGSTGNPYHILLNPTLAAHCKAMYAHLQQNAPLQAITFIQRKGVQEEKISTYFSEAERSGAGVPLKIRKVIVQDSLDTETLSTLLDSSRQNTLIIGSLDQGFAQTIFQQLGTLPKTNKFAVMGMPNWEQWDLSRPVFRGMEISYGTAFFIDPANNLALRLQQQLKSARYIRTSENTYRSFECLFYLGHLPLAKKGEYLNLIKGTHATLFGNWDIRPVYNKKTGVAEFSENRKITFIKKLDGQVKVTP